jgi:hypothetical protein
MIDILIFSGRKVLPVVIGIVEIAVALLHVVVVLLLVHLYETLGNTFLVMYIDVLILR